MRAAIPAIDSTLTFNIRVRPSPCRPLCRFQGAKLGQGVVEPVLGFLQAVRKHADPPFQPVRVIPRGQVKCLPGGLLNLDHLLAGRCGRRHGMPEDGTRDHHPGKSGGDLFPR